MRHALGPHERYGAMHAMLERRKPLVAAISAAVLIGALNGPAAAQAFPEVLSLSSLDGSIGFKLDGEEEKDTSGTSVSAAGDVNGDGIADLIIGADRASPNGLRSGRSYVVFGRGTGFPATLPLSALDGSTGFKLDGEAVRDYSGFSVSAAGDVNGDGIDDVIVGAYGADPNGSYSGCSYVVFGRDAGFPATLQLSALDGSTGFKLNGEAADDHAGNAVNAAGDVNGDGIADLIIGAWGSDPNGANSGRSYVVFGRNTGFSATLQLSSLDGSTGFKIDGEAAGDRSGRSVNAAGDVNGDGIADLIIGAYGGGSGRSHVVFGRDTGFPATLPLSALDGSDGFQLDGEAESDRFGFSVGAAGDINGDGIDDLIVGADSADPNGTSSGRSYVVFGRGTGFPATLQMSLLDGSTGFKIDGEAADDFSGHTVSAAGDVNVDGIDDLIIGAFGADPNGESSGRSYVVFGRDTGFPATLPLSSLDGSTGFKLDGEATDDVSGDSVSAAGDINGDGIDDLIIGAFFAGPKGSNAGRSYVVFGRDPDTIFANGFEPD